MSKIKMQMDKFVRTLVSLSEAMNIAGGSSADIIDDVYSGKMSFEEFITIIGNNNIVFKYIGPDITENTSRQDDDSCEDC